MASFFQFHIAYSFGLPAWGRSRKGEGADIARFPAF
jgi:hypothetical protein